MQALTEALKETMAYLEQLPHGTDADTPGGGATFVRDAERRSSAV